MKIRGRVKSIVFQSTTSLFKVLSVEVNNETISVTGEFPLIDEGALYEFEGVSKIHPKFGVQFEASSSTSLKETSEDGLIAYLSSSRFKGIGKKLAESIVKTLGIDAIEKIKKDSTSLSKIKGISEKKAIELRDEIIKNASTETIFIKLFSYGLTKGAANKIFNKYELDTLRKIEENPYILIHDLDGFGFVRSDDLAIKMGFSENSDIRIEEALLYNLDLVCENLGYTFLTEEALLNETKLLLNRRSKNHVFEASDLKFNLMSLVSKGSLIKVDNLIYPKRLYDAEFEVSQKILSLLSHKQNVNLSKLDSLISESESFIKFSLTDEQKKAIRLSLSETVSIITGGPGTGKTTILKCLLRTKALLLNLDMNSASFSKRVLLLSPTGKASKRMMVQTEFRAQTIHKALSYDEYGRFLKNEGNMLDEDFIIVDEASMIDIELFNHLLKALKPNAQLILVGDVDQLPSVGPGNVLNDLINSKMIKTSYLTQIMRQKGDSKIVKLAHMVNTKNIDYSIFNDKKEVFFYKQDESNIMSLIVRIVEKYIASGADMYNDLQILAPMYSGFNGIDNINNNIQNLFNKSNEYIKYNDKTFKVGDKVLQLQNDPRLEIMNGDTGVIKAISKADDETYLYIMFDKMVKYPYSDLSNLTLGYCISIHKSQGSEFKNVIVPISQAFRLMLKKKLVYTAITRAKEKIILIGSDTALNNSLYQEDSIRQTTLARMINPKLIGKKNDYIEINDPISAFKYILEENMENISPYTFMEDKHD